jgi:phosphoglycerate dehydrogenase-like enzyme
MLAICSRSVSRSKDALNLLKKKFNKIKLNKSKKNLTNLRLKNFIKDCSTIIIGVEKIDKELLDSAPKLKLIGKYGVGTNNIDFKELKKRKIKILLQPGINKRAVSELTLSFMIAGIRKIYSLIKQVKKKKWPYSIGGQLTNKNIGIIGCGNIGKDLINLLTPFNCKIYTNDINPDQKFLKKFNLKNYSLNHLLKNCDIITLHIPYNKKNHRLISKKQIKMLKKEVIFINTSRGGIVDEKFLYSFLKKNKSSQAIFDVMNEEPPKDFNLIKLKNFMLTPHIAGSTDFTLKKASIDCAQKIINVIK